MLAWLMILKLDRPHLLRLYNMIDSLGVLRDLCRDLHRAVVRLLEDVHGDFLLQDVNRVDAPVRPLLLRLLPNQILLRFMD